MISFLIVGSGYRAEFYARIARKYSTLFRAMFLCRSEEKAAAVEQRTGVNGTASLESALAFHPDFIVVAVDNKHVGDVTEEWALRGYPVLSETPVGCSVEQLERLRKLQQEKGALISCAEQYHRYPVLAEGIRRVESGLIGRPCSIYISLAHEYHGFSLIRRILQTTGEEYTMVAVRQRSETAATDSRYGAILDGSIAQEERYIAYITFSSGKTAIYDFADLQYRSFIRSRHLTVRGERGEWNDRIMSFVDADNKPGRICLMPEIPDRFQQLDTQTLRDGRKTWTPELFLDTEQDEFAAASMLLDMGAYISGGPSPYPLEEAVADAYFCLLLRQAVEQPFKKFTGR